jgi:hypothetical protein
MYCSHETSCELCCLVFIVTLDLVLSGKDSVQPGASVAISKTLIVVDGPF